VKYRAPISPCILSNKAYTTKKENIMTLETLITILIIAGSFGVVSGLAYWLAEPTLEDFDKKAEFINSLTREDF
tara:strand:- start:24 stop:245 length:222 start_codon:yes stop_codon:yes gene_type:complete